MTNEESDTGSVASHRSNEGWVGDNPLASGGLLQSDDGRYLANPEVIWNDYIIPAELANRLGLRNLEILAAPIAGDHTELGGSSPTDD